MVHGPFALAFTSGVRFGDDDFGIIVMHTRVLGGLRVPSGWLFVSDPFVTDFADPGSPLAQRAPTGVFPVEIAIAEYENGDQRIACARVRFRSDVAAERWEVAPFEGQELTGDQYPGYGVDAGTGCFFDRAARAEVEEAVTEAWLAAHQENSVNTWSWHVADVGEANVIMFSSGWGDGFYPSYWGFGAGGELVELVTDFELLIGSERRNVELALPLPRGRVAHPLFDEHDIVVKAPFFSRNAVVIAGTGSARVRLSDDTPVSMTRGRANLRFFWPEPRPGTRLVVGVRTGHKPLEPIDE